jgi:aryl-alcohol dehydrogenase-like predicted oxidoreductase
MSEGVRDMLAREAAEAQERADAEERGEIAPAPGQRGRRRAVDPSQVYAVRIPVSQLRKLREVADNLNMQPSALIRQWVIEQLDALDASGVSDLDEN